MGIIRSSHGQSLHVLGPKDLKGKGKQKKNPETKFEAPNPKVENQQHEEPSDSKKNTGKGHHGKEKVKCSYCGKGFHPEHACMKKKLDEATSLLEKNHINLPKSFRGEISKIKNHNRKEVMLSWKAFQSPKHS